MILVDFRQTVISNAMVLFHREKMEINESVIRHAVLNSLRSYRNKFHQKFGEIVICLEGVSWRYNQFQHYKAGRKKDDGFDWEALDRYMNTVVHELSTFFPYPVIQHPDAEADDIIAVLAQNYRHEPVLIISGDKDFIQLQSYSHVQQYDPVKGAMIKESNPERYLRESIIRGCDSDRIPNIGSDSDTFVVDGKRQKPMTKKLMEVCLKSIPPEFQKRYDENQKLIDFQCIPTDIENEIVVKYNESLILSKERGRNQLFNYFVDKQLKLLLSSIREF